MKHDIFISYRREGGFEVANLIASKLRLCGYRVFLDIHALHEGDFSIQLQNKVKECKDFIWILSPTIEKYSGESISTLHFRDGVDYYRDEICWAIKYHKNIVPVLLNGFVFDSEIPKVIEETIDTCSPGLDLRKLQMVETYKNQYFDASISQLRKCIKSFPIYRYLVYCVSLFSLLVLSLFVYNLAQKDKVGHCYIRIVEAEKHNFLFTSGQLELIVDGHSLGIKNIYDINDEIIYPYKNPKSKTAILKFSAEGYNDMTDTINLKDKICFKINRDDTYAKYWGFVQDSKTNYPVDSVLITIEGRQTYTDVNGYFQIIFPIEEQSLFKRMTAYKSGYKTFERSVVYPREIRFHIKSN